MDEGVGRPAEDDRDWAASQRSSLRALLRLVMADHPIEKARERAKETLRKSGQPTIPGHYALAPDGTLTPAPLEDFSGSATPTPLLVRLPSGERTSVSWIAPLAEALARIGYGPGSPEVTAAKLLADLARVGDHVRAGLSLRSMGTFGPLRP
jgi:hypothetical protein